MLQETLISAKEAIDRMFDNAWDALNLTDKEEANSHIIGINQHIKTCIYSKSTSFKYDLHTEFIPVSTYVHLKLLREGYSVDIDHCSDDDYDGVMVLKYSIKIQ